jgi:hypothetical protein
MVRKPSIYNLGAIMNIANKAFNQFKLSDHNNLYESWKAITILSDSKDNFLRIVENLFRGIELYGSEHAIVSDSSSGSITVQYWKERRKFYVFITDGNSIFMSEK